MCRQTKKGVAIMPMYVHSFRFVTPHTMTEAQRFNLLFPNPESCTHVSDKLRYYRYQNVNASDKMKENAEEKM